MYSCFKYTPFLFFISYFLEAAEKTMGSVLTDTLEDEDRTLKDFQAAPGDCFYLPY